MDRLVFLPTEYLGLHIYEYVCISTVSYLASVKILLATREIVTQDMIVDVHVFYI